jgi:hypothetical protein
MPPVSDFNILDVLKDRREHCRELLKLTRQQQTYIETNNFVALLQVLGRKQRILGSMDDITSGIPNLKQAWRLQRASLDHALREECEHVMAETEAIFTELLEEESDSTDFLLKRREKSQGQLQAAGPFSDFNTDDSDPWAVSYHHQLDVDT